MLELIPCKYGGLCYGAEIRLRQFNIFGLPQFFILRTVCLLFKRK